MNNGKESQISKSGTEQFPDFFLVGQMKAGTTALWHFLGEHPEIFMSTPKEPSFFYCSAGVPRFFGPSFSKEFEYKYTPPICGQFDAASLKKTALPGMIEVHGISDVSNYLALFAHAPPNALRGEASTIYLYDPRVPTLIAQKAKRAKIIIVLRDPVERAFSQYVHMVRIGREFKTFIEATADEPRRIAAGWEHNYHYCNKSIYRPQIERYLQSFDADAVKIGLYDDLRADAAAFVRDIYEFLQVDANFKPNCERRYNVNATSWSPKREGVRVWLRYLKRRLSGQKIPVKKRSPTTKKMPELTAQAREVLRPKFEEDIKWLEEFLRRDLSEWRR